MATVLPTAGQLGISGGRLSVIENSSVKFRHFKRNLSESFNVVSLNVVFKTFVPLAVFLTFRLKFVLRIYIHTERIFINLIRRAECSNRTVSPQCLPQLSDKNNTVLSVLAFEKKTKLMKDVLPALKTISKSAFNFT